MRQTHTKQELPAALHPERATGTAQREESLGVHASQSLDLRFHQRLLITRAWWQACPDKAASHSVCATKVFYSVAPEAVCHPARPLTSSKQLLCFRTASAA